ncbi:RUNX1T1 isoform 38 [Pan troglodytes]|uniref:RUNX1 partner transcriptional co-repressor 1 n=3 Tax=Hominidae TaxID=9604 RepID=E7EQJ1_HUMAN|nr:RUNX1T1 isoform 34 [Pan troglodytes]PNJ44263.1 RUNX1T1 isoform 33 [Pongo abelii]PNI84943.1 RUNX1T1 isoform 36 [Pan troglodytes]PNI84945.1 RUNX1T1 isoform 38 [Pan troglodytes]PNJ44265.1 RUNX1T1 isoform 35 [Pongo abelii]
MISVKRNTWRALSLVIGDCRKKGNFEYCQDKPHLKN